MWMRRWGAGLTLAVMAGMLSGCALEEAAERLLSSLASKVAEKPVQVDLDAEGQSIGLSTEDTNLVFGLPGVPADWPVDLLPLMPGGQVTSVQQASIDGDITMRMLTWDVPQPPQVVRAWYEERLSQWERFEDGPTGWIGESGKTKLSIGVWPGAAGHSVVSLAHSVG